MKARPILFSAPMIKALLAGTKTQTRRVVKPRADKDMGPKCVLQPHELAGEVNGGNYRNCPYGEPGDLLWVRESIAVDYEPGESYDPMGGDGGHFGARHGISYGNATCPSIPYLVYAADGVAVDEGQNVGAELPMRGRPSIHMPRWASRLTLRITDVRVQRLQDCSNEDAVAEGIGTPTDMRYATVDGYRPLWESINGPGSWEANPWVFALTFEVIKANVDTVLP